MIKNKLDYTVAECLDDLDGHNLDRIIKIKLCNGEVKTIDGVEFLNSCIGGDDIIYLKELDPIRAEYERRVEMFIDFCEKIISVCEKTYEDLDKEFNGDFDNCDILDIENEIAKSCDDWFRWLKLDIKYEPGCGSVDELFFKIEVLNKWLKGSEIPKEVPTF